MNRKDKIENDYFEWIYDLMCDRRYAKDISYRKLLSHLHSVEFTYTIQRDSNRAADGIELRYRFSLAKNHKDWYLYLDGPCSVLEMMVALAIRCEEGIMDDPSIGDRTGQWFWGMITSLGLGSMLDEQYDRRYVDYIIQRFLNREYKPNGEGGLFTIRNTKQDMRTVEIWYQLNEYINTIV